MTDFKPDLDAFFDAAQANPPRPSSELMARVRYDADQQMTSVAITRAPKRPIRQHIMALWPMWAGCVPAALVGLWIGINPPDVLPDPVLWFSASEDSDDVYFADYDDWAWPLEEGLL